MLLKNIFTKPHLLERFFEVNTCKAFQLTQYCEGYLSFFKEGTDIVTFKTTDELLEKVKYYLKNESKREKIASLAYNKTIKSFTSDFLLKKAFSDMEKHNPDSYKKINPSDFKIKYLNAKEILSDDKSLKNQLEGCDYVCFNESGFKPLQYKDFLQVQALERMQKPISVADVYQSSRLIGDYASICSRGLLEYYGKEALNKTVSLAQIMVRKSYLLNNLSKFRSFFKDKTGLSLDLDNTIFITIPLLRTYNKIKVPFQGQEHLYIGYFEREILYRWKNKILFSDSYVYKLMMYSALNWFILKYLLTYTIRKSKNPKAMKISDFYKKINSRADKKG